MRYDAALAPCGSYDDREVEEALRLSWIGPADLISSGRDAWWR
jgi:hypothetical protein